MNIARHGAILLLCAGAVACAAPPARSTLMPIGSARDSFRTVTFDAREGTRIAFDVSRDGHSIVFDLLGQIWELPGNGGKARQLTHAVRDTADDLDPSLSPDGEWIAFRGDRGSRAGLWIMRRGGSDIRLLTDTLLWDARSPAWSTDGQEIAFTSRDTIRIITMATGVTRTLRIDSLSPPGLTRTPAWSPDGARIAFAHGGRIMEVSVDGGAATPLTAASLRGAAAPAYSPDGSRLAFFATDQSGAPQVFLISRSDTVATQLSRDDDVTNLRARWTPAGDVVYAANGKLWRRASDTESAVEIPFIAHVAFERYDPPAPAVRFPAAGSEHPARGFSGLAISADGERVGMLALGKLWVMEASDAAGTARAVTTVPYTANGVAWSPDGRQVAWSAGAGGSEDLFVTDISTGRTRRIVALPGREERAAWSPDGLWIAFVHWPKPACDTPPSRWLDDECGMLRLRAVRVPESRDSAVSRIEDTRLLASPGASWYFAFFPAGLEVPHWSADGAGIYYHDNGQLLFAPLEGGTARQLGSTGAATWLHRLADSSMIFVRDNQLWRAEADGNAGPLSSEPALYASVARTGRVLALSRHGLVLHEPGGNALVIGWPLRYRAATAPEQLLIRGARVFDGTGAPAVPRDILITGDRIAHVADSGAVVVDGATRVISAEGATVIPGLIDLHGHLWDDAMLPAALSHGVTAMREMGGAVARVAGFRDAIAAGAVQGPRLVFGGLQFNPTGRGGTSAVAQAPSDLASGARGLAILQALGGAYAKMRLVAGYTGDGVAFVRAARQEGLRVSGHCAHTLPLVAAGISAKEHLGPACGDRSDAKLYDDLASLYREAGMPVVTTTVAFTNLPRALRDSTLFASGASPFHTPFLRWWARRAPSTTAVAYDRFRHVARGAAGSAHARGVTLIPSSDDPTFPDALHTELEELVGVGLTPAEALAGATSKAARALGAETEIGTIAPGMLADLVILDDDPLVDIRNTRRIRHVIQGGRIVDRGALAEMVERD